LLITGQHWNRVSHNAFERETSRAIEENVLSGAEKTILRLKSHTVRQNEGGLELIESNA
jgi:hypothetical protein